MGTDLRDYRLDKKLGVGPHGEVWLATHVDGAQVRLKHAFAPPDAVKVFERIAAAFTRFGRRRPPGLETPRATVLPDRAGRFAVVTAWEDGDLVEAYGPQGVPGPFDLVEQVGECLWALHQEDGAHGSVRPSNIRWDGYRAVLLDFFWAQGCLHRDDPYRAPEQAFEDRPRPEADQWAWGRLARDLLAESPLPGLREVVERCMHVDPNQRYVDLGEALLMFQALRPASVDLVGDATIPVQAPAPTLVMAAAGAGPREPDASEAKTPAAGGPIPDGGQGSSPFLPGFSDADLPSEARTEDLSGLPVPPRPAPRRRPDPEPFSPPDPTTQLPAPRSGRWAMVLWSAALGLVGAAGILWLFWDGSPPR